MRRQTRSERRLPWIVWPHRLAQVVTRPWRLDPELDRFSDEQCRPLAAVVGPLRVAGLLIAGLIAVFLGAPSLIAWTSLVERVSDATRIGFDDRATACGRGAFAFSLLVLVPTVASIAMSPYIQIVARALRRELDRVRCPSCRYLLMGLPVEQGTLQCPECGQIHALATMGITPDDVRTGSIARALSPSRPPRRFGLMHAAILVAAIALIGWVITGFSWLGTAVFIALYGIVMPAAITMQREATRPRART